MKHYPFLDLKAVNAPYEEELVRAAERVVRSGRYVGGPEVERFEEQMKALTGAPYIIGVSNGLDALRLVLRAWVELGKLKKGDSVIVPANTYIASVLAITDAGLTPILAEPDPDTMNLDTARLEEYYTPEVKAIMPVHLYGRVCWDEKLVEFIKGHDLLVIEDNAQAIGTTATLPGLFGTTASGSLGHAGAFSFYPTKNTGALGDAGAVATHDPDLAAAVRALANYGADRRYHNIYPGFNCRLDPMQAALLAVKLPYVKKENADRFERALAYSRTLAGQGADIVRTPLMSMSVTDMAWHQYVIRILRGSRDSFREALKAAGVDTDIHYAVPPHRQPCYAGGRLPHSPLPVTELLASQIVSLPIATGTSVKDCAEIGEIINSLQW